MGSGVPDGASRLPKLCRTHWQERANHQGHERTIQNSFVSLGVLLSGLVTNLLCIRHRRREAQFCYSEPLGGARTHEKRQ
jgi:hypothetical protein